jgi:hypothetical protein
MQKILAVSLLGFALAACDAGGGSQEAGDDDIGAQTGRIGNDNDVMREANAAAGDVIRAAGDCEAVKAALPEARRKLDELAAKIQTETGKASLGALRTRVDQVAELCP